MNHGLNSAMTAKRGIVAIMMAAIAAFAIAFAALAAPSQAYADTVAPEDMVVGQTYTASVNPVVPMNVHNLIKFDAVITDTTTPTLFKKPTTYQVDNGTIVKNADGTYTVRVDTFNNTFGVWDIATSSSDGATLSKLSWIPWNVGGHAERLDGFTATLDNTSGAYVFDAHEYANFMGQGEKEFPITLKVDFSSIKTQ